MTIDFFIEFVSKNGFPIFLALCFGYIVYYFWKFVKEEIKPGLILILDHLNKTNSNMRSVCNMAENLKQKITLILVMRNK